MSIAVNPGLGTLLQHGVTSTYTTVGQRVSLEGPGMEVGEVETTDLDSATKLYRPTLPDGGTVSGKLWYDPQDAIHKLMFGMVGTPAIEEWKLTFADATNGPTTYAFNGFLKKFSPTGMEAESNLEVDFEIRVNGIPVSTP